MSHNVQNLSDLVGNVSTLQHGQADPATDAALAEWCTVFEASEDNEIPHTTAEDEMDVDIETESQTSDLSDPPSDLSSELSEPPPELAEELADDDDDDDEEEEEEEESNEPSEPSDASSERSETPSDIMESTEDPITGQARQENLAPPTRGGETSNELVISNIQSGANMDRMNEILAALQPLRLEIATCLTCHDLQQQVARWEPWTPETGVPGCQYWFARAQLLRHWREHVDRSEITRALLRRGV